MTIKERIENNLVIWMLGILLSGFLAGLGAYEGILKIAHLKVVSSDNKTKQSVFAGADNPQIYWLKITNVSFDKGGGIVQGVRVHGRVDDNPIAYPIKTVWALPNSDRTSSVYPLYLQRKKGRLDFEVIASTKAGLIIPLYSISNVMEMFDVTQTPYTDVIRVCAVGSELLATDGCANVRVEIRKDPF